MSISFFHYNNKPELYYSLERYLKYFMEENVSFINPNILNQSTNFSILLTVNDSKNLEDCCRWMYHNKVNPEKLRILGFENKSDINLLIIDNLKSQFENSFKIKKRINRIKIPFFRDQVIMFFKGHGEQSLFQCLTYVRYNLGNYTDLVKSREYPIDGLHENFLLPGVQSWHEFVRRFNKYVPILYVCGWISETDKIEQLTKIISFELDKIDPSESFVIFDLESVSIISEIVAIMEELSQQSEYK